MIRLSRPYITEETISRACDVLRSGILVQGEYVAQFEKRLATYLDVPHAVLVSSGTAALHISLLAAGIGKGDEVIVPAFTFPATANAVALTGAKPVLVDIGLDDFCVDVNLVEKAVTSKTKAIIPVHEFGLTADMDAIKVIADKYGIIIIEDAACALSAEYKGGKAGTFGLAGCFSFHPRKALTTGEGGLVVTSDEDFADTLRVLRNHGMLATDGVRDFVRAGLNYRMTDFQAVIGMGQLDTLEDIIGNRITIASEYDKLLSSVSWITTPYRYDDRRHVYQTYHILIDENICREELRKYLAENSVESNFGANALNLLSYYQKEFNCKPGQFPFAERAFKKGLALPSGMHIKENEVNYICNTLNNYAIKG